MICVVFPKNVPTLRMTKKPEIEVNSTKQTTKTSLGGGLLKSEYIFFETPYRWILIAMEEA